MKILPPDFSIPAIVLKKCKNELAKPLLLMWNESIRCGIVPSLYKQQLITPVFKKGSRSLPSNYRPVSLTAHEVKIFERVLRNKMVDFLEGNNLLSCKQHGFRKGRSCLTQLLQHYDKILLNLMDNQETDCIYLDYAKAFDKVDHQILVQKLKNIGIGGKLCKWLENFLLNRKQMVVVDDVFSYITYVLSGVPQALCLDPFFSLFSQMTWKNVLAQAVLVSLLMTPGSSKKYLSLQIPVICRKTWTRSLNGQTITT